jgi:hypothetical protein
MFVRHSIFYAFSVGVMNLFVREKDDYMFLYESYYLFSYRAQQWFVIPPPLIQTLENVQRRAARFVINDYTSRTQGCVTSMLTSLEWQTLEQRRDIQYGPLLFFLNSTVSYT